MKLGSQNAQGTEKSEPTAKTREQRQKRERRKAPPYTLVWSEEVQTLPDISTNEVIELRKKALWRIELAEAALNGDSSVARFGAAAHAEDIVWSQFQVGKYWFCIEFRAANIREYVVKLAGPPRPDDTPPPPGNLLAERRTHDDLPSQARDSRSRKKDCDGSKSEFGRGAAVLWRFTRRTLNRNLTTSRTKFASKLIDTLTKAGVTYRNVSYNMRNLSASLGEKIRRFVWTIAGGSSSFTRIGDLPTYLVGSNARLEPRCVGQNSGIHVLLYSWVRDEAPAVDWNADLFGALPTDWAANLFGALPKEERVFR
ncbi:MAG: hypothetical protein ACT4OF_14770 [Caulobacteraceae bacterium]